jgi:broad-specificity NMP kinase
MSTSRRTASKRDKGNFAFERIRSHFHPFEVEKLVTTIRTFPSSLRVELAQPLVELTEEVGAGGFGGLYCRSELTGFPGLMVTDPRDAVRIASSQFEEVQLGDGERRRILKNGLWLGGTGDQRFAVFCNLEQIYGGEPLIRLEIAEMPGATGGERILARFDDALKRSAVLRGRTLSLVHGDAGWGSVSLKVHSLTPVMRDALILPEATLDLIDRNVLRFAMQRPALAALGLAVRKGVLFYGPPGTGKTHTIRYIASTLKDATVLLVRAEEIGHLREYILLARALQPAVVVIEDVDLVGEDRDSGHNNTPVVLNELLNEMDGLNEDAEIIFILTTNRPEVLEPALAGRPGRIDQAIEIPLPDDACRRELVKLYARKMNIDADTTNEIARRTKGVTASFIKELVRRAAQVHLDANGTGPVPCEVFLSAIEEMTMIGGKLNAKLLGAEKHSPGFMRAA